MTWPATQVKTSFDQSSDDPKVARSEIAGNVDKFNLLQAHVSSFMQTFLARASAALGRTDLELGTAALKDTGTSGDALALLNASANWSNAFLLSGVISPAQITANLNNYNPSGLSGAVQLRLNSDASRNVTGLAGGATGRLLMIANIGSTDIVLVSESASSTAANRFLFAGGDRTLTADESVLLKYDGTSSRWRAAQDKRSGITRETAQSTTSGTSKTFGSLPAGINRITIMLDDVSLNGTEKLLIQIGDAGGIETSGYKSGASIGTFRTPATNGFILTHENVAAGLWSGIITLARIDGNTWVSNGNIYTTDTDQVNSSGGNKTLTAELTQIQLLDTGADSFDSGQINVFTE